MRTYTVLEPSTRQELRQLIKERMDETNIVPITVREELDELSARRREAEAEEFRLKILSIHFGDDGFIIATVVDSTLTARIDWDMGYLRLTTVGPGEFTLATP